MDEDAQERLAQAAERKRERDREDLRLLMNAAFGRRFLWRLLESAGVLRSSYSENPARMAFNEGARNQGLLLWAELAREAPEQFMLMLEENRNDP